MNLWDIAVYLTWSFLAMAFMFLAMAVISFGYLKNEEKMMGNFIDLGTERRQREGT